MSKPSPTLAEIAKLAGVSPMTASRALGNRPGVSRAKREEILLIAGEMGYVANRAAQMLSIGQHRVIGMIAPAQAPFTGDLVTGVGSAARAAGYELLLYTLLDSDRPPLSGVMQMLEPFVDGIIALHPHEGAYLDALAAAPMPVVAIEPQAGTCGFPAILGDSDQGARRAVRYLAELGHRRIAFVSGDERLASARDRRRGYEDAMRTLELPFTPDMIAEGDGLQMARANTASRLLSQSPRPTAIFAASDVAALGVMLAIRDAGMSVPGDVSVIGCDDIPLAAQFHPALTTVRPPVHQMGRAAVNTLLAMVVGLEAASPRIVLPSELVVRASTAAPRA